MSVLYIILLLFHKKKQKFLGQHFISKTNIHILHFLGWRWLDELNETYNFVPLNYTYIDCVYYDNLFTCPILQNKNSASYDFHKIRILKGVLCNTLMHTGPQTHILFINKF